MRFNGIQDLATDGTSLYVIDTGTCASIRKVDIATGATSTVTSYTTVSHDSVAPDGYLYLSINGFIYKIDLSTNTQTTFVSGESAIGALAADSTTMYWTTVAGTVRKLSLSSPGGTPTTLASNGPNVSALISAGDYLYGSGPNGATLMRWAKSDGSAVTVAGSSPGFVNSIGTLAAFHDISSVASDGTDLYVTDSENDWVDNLGSGNYLLRKVHLATIRCRCRLLVRLAKGWA